MNGASVNRCILTNTLAASILAEVPFAFYSGIEVSQNKLIEFCGLIMHK